MRGTFFFAMVAALMLASSAVQAATWTDPFRYDQGTVDKFPPNQLSLDLFGTYATADRFGVKRDRWGGGLGLNYFFMRYIGIGADSYLEEWKWPYRVNGSLFLRLPTQSGLAPYAFGGGGREFKYAPQWTYHAGGGLEFRLNRHFGVFADGRQVWPKETRDYVLARAGVRLNF